jgi:hypothetical protein
VFFSNPYTFWEDLPVLSSCSARSARRFSPLYHRANCASPLQHYCLSSRAVSGPWQSALSAAKNNFPGETSHSSPAPTLLDSSFSSSYSSSPQLRSFPTSSHMCLPSPSPVKLSPSRSTMAHQCVYCRLRTFTPRIARRIWRLPGPPQHVHALRADRHLLHRLGWRALGTCPCHLQYHRSLSIIPGSHKEQSRIFSSTNAIGAPFVIF